MRLREAVLQGLDMHLMVACRPDPADIENNAWAHALIPMRVLTQEGIAEVLALETAGCVLDIYQHVRDSGFDMTPGALWRAWVYFDTPQLDRRPTPGWSEDWS